jgi:hypothetical protein
VGSLSRIAGRGSHSKCLSLGPDGIMRRHKDSSLPFPEKQSSFFMLLLAPELRLI